MPRVTVLPAPSPASASASASAPSPLGAVEARFGTRITRHHTPSVSWMRRSGDLQNIMGKHGDYIVAPVNLLCGVNQLTVGPVGDDDENSTVVEESKDAVVYQVMCGSQRSLWTHLESETASVKVSEERARMGVKAAAVVVVTRKVDGAVLLTRRPAHMRSFPCAWVVPGGAVDDGETVEEAAAREVLEETGLLVCAENLRCVAAWESAYPVDASACTSGDGMRAHALMVGFTADCLDTEALHPSADEVDAAVWVTRDALRRIVFDDGSTPHEAERVSDGLMASQLEGVYPNAMGEGIALGHRFVLQKLLLEG